jgi:NADP-dependent 3-hydroxy acid dehydrogenase YdfG
MSLSASKPLYSTLDISGQVALITGASAGIGEACAWRFAEAGAVLVLIGRRTERLATLSAALKEAYPSIVEPHCVTLDVQDVAAIEALPAQLPPAYANVNILVNNAGLALGVAGAADNKMSDVAQMISTNVTGLIAFCSAFLPGMRARGSGHLINIGSIAGHEAYAGGSVYPIRVTAISPGMVKTDFSVVRFGGDQATADKVYEDIEPLVAADIADNVMYAATRPKHVQIADLIVLATNQAAAKVVARVGPSLGAPSLQ